jgi:hypothetical protein
MLMVVCMAGISYGVLLEAYVDGLGYMLRHMAGELMR